LISQIKVLFHKKSLKSISPPLFGLILFSDDTHKKKKSRRSAFANYKNKKVFKDIVCPPLNIHILSSLSLFIKKIHSITKNDF